jgi:hypothetical protein
VRVIGLATFRALMQPPELGKKYEKFGITRRNPEQGARKNEKEKKHKK